MGIGELRRRFKNSLVSGIAFGGGLALGSVVMQLLFGLVSRLSPGILDERGHFSSTMEYSPIVIFRPAQP